MRPEDDHDGPAGTSKRATVGRAVSQFAPSRRRLLTMVGAGLVGGAATNPGAVAELARQVPLGTGNDSPLDLVPSNRMTHTAVESGRWDDASVWEGEKPPADDAWVHIPEDVTVTLAGETARLHALRVDGTLTVDPATDTHLLADTIVTTPESELSIGTPTAPVVADATARITFADFGPIDEGWDTERVSRGLVAMGDLSIVGAKKTSWTELARHPRAGDRTLDLPTAPTNWAIGDELVVPGTSALEEQDEEVAIASVDGTTVTLDRPLEYDHVPPKESFDSYVLSLTRNVQLRSENTDIPRRGHVMVHGTESEVRYAAFDGLGRTDKSYPFTDGLHGTPPKDVEPNPKARYALHYHKTGIGEPPHTVAGVVVDGSPGWGIVNHHSHATVRDSITYDVFGAGFVAEAGNERGTFERNFALRSTGSGERMDSREFKKNGNAGQVDDFGHGGHGFWLQGSQVGLRDNVAAGHRHHGFAFWNRSLVDRPLENDESIGDRSDNIENFPTEFVAGMEPLKESDAVVDGMAPASHLPLVAFENNTAFASGGGLALTRHQFRWRHERYADYGTIDRFTAYEIGPLKNDDGRLVGPEWDDDRGGNQAILFRYSRNVRVRDAHLVGRGPGSGINRNEPYTQHLIVEDSTIEGWEVGVRASEDFSIIRRNRFDNQIDINLDKERLPELLAYDNDYGPKRTANVRFENIDREHVHFDDFLFPDWNDGIILDGKRAYYGQQAPDRVPFPNSNALKKLAEPGSDDWQKATERLGTKPTALVGKTNAELHSEFGVAAYGEPMPDSAELSHTVSGGRIDSNPTLPRSVWLDATAGSIGEIFQQGSDPSASNGRYISVLGAASHSEPPIQSGIARYPFEVAAGSYAVYGRIWPMDGNTFWLRVDGGEWHKWAWFWHSRGWRWYTLQREAEDDDHPRRFDLDAGEHTLEIGYRGNRVRLDTLLIEADGTPPIGPGLAAVDRSQS